MENKTGKYLKYAIGEIVLVMIGILLALQVNNWNTNRAQKQKEQILLTALNKEFKANKLQLDLVISKHRGDMKSNAYLVSRLPIKDVKKENLDSLAYHLWNHTSTYTFNPSNGVTNSIMNSSSINIISNNELRQLLVGWNDLLLDYQEEEILARDNYHNLLKPYEKKHTVFSYDYKQWYKDPRLGLDFLETVEFENYVRDRYYDLGTILSKSSGELELVTKTINQIIELSKTDIDD